MKKEFLEISQNSQENTCVRVSFLIKLQVPAFINVPSRLKPRKPFPYQRETGYSGRKTKILYGKLGKINSRCEYFVHCAGLQNSFLPNPISVWSSPVSKGEPRGKVTNKFRNKGNVDERCNSTGEIRTWVISEQFVLSKQEGWRSLTCNKSQISEQVHTIPTFQNGRDALNKGSSPITRFFDKDRSKGCLF